MPAPIIIYARDKSISKKVFQTAIAVSIWSIVLALLIRLATALAWYFLASTFYKELAVPKAFLDVVVLIEYLLAFNIAVFLLNYVWIKYNYYRYGQNERRKHPGYGKKNQTLASLANISLIQIRQLQNSKLTLLHNNERESTVFHVSKELNKPI